MIESRLGARRPFAELLEGFSEFAGFSTGDSGVSQLRTHSCCDASPSAGDAHGTVRQLWSQNSETAYF